MIPGGTITIPIYVVDRHIWCACYINVSKNDEKWIYRQNRFQSSSFTLSFHHLPLQWMILVICDVVHDINFVRLQSEIQSPHIKVNIPGVLGTWNDRDIHMDCPPKDDLRGYKLVMSSNVKNDGRIEDRVFIQPMEINPLSTCGGKYQNNAEYIFKKIIIVTTLKYLSNFMFTDWGLCSGTFPAWQLYHMTPNLFPIPIQRLKF